MGSNWSSDGSGSRVAVSHPTAHATDPPVHLDDIRAEATAWDQNGFCRSVQRFLGLLPDSPTEVLKQQQRFPVFTRRPSTSAFILASGDDRRGAAIVAVQRLYRRYRLLRMWHETALPLLEVAREQLEAQRETEKAEFTVASFRQMLVEGFAANKVAISGELKTVHLRLVANADMEEFYLTWTPSRKRNPRIYLHDVEEVVPVLKEGNLHAPKLAAKVSHRRGLIILCKSHHRGRVILEVGSKHERKLLVQGFACLLEEMNREEPMLDESGALRRRQPRRQSVADFFDASASAAIAQTPPSALKAADPSRPTAMSQLFKQTLTTSGDGDGGEGAKLLSDTNDGANGGSPRRRLSIEELYRTRFDPPSQSPETDVRIGEVSKSQPCSPAVRRSSVVMDVRGTN